MRIPAVWYRPQNESPSVHEDERARLPRYHLGSPETGALAAPTNIGASL